MRARTRPLLPLLTTLMILAGSLQVACGAGEPKTVRLAVGLPVEAPFGREILKGVEMALEDAQNRAGRWRVETLIFNTYDSQAPLPLSDPFEFEAAEAAIADESVVAYLGGLSSHQAKAIMPVLNHASMALVSPSATWPGLTKAGFAPGEPGSFYPTGQRHFFRVIPTDDMLVQAAARWSRDLGVRRIFLIDNGHDHGKNTAAIFETAARDFEILSLGSFSLRPGMGSAPPHEFEAIAEQVAQAKPDLVYYGGAAGGPAPHLIPALLRVLPDLRIMGPDTLVSHELIEQLGPRAEGLMATHLLPPRQMGSRARAFVERFQAKYGAVPQHSILCAYEATHVLLLAISEAQRGTRQHVLKSLQDLQEVEGLFGRWHFDEFGDISDQPIGGFVVRGGEWTFEKRL